MTMRIVLAGGGTGGHVVPALALARVLTGRGHDVSFVGTEGGLEARLVPAAAIEFHAIKARPFVRALSLAAMRAPFVALRAVREAVELVRGADVVVGMGGYVSVPTVLAARRVGVPSVLHEQNAVPGLANRVLSRFSRAVVLSFADARRRFPRGVATEVTGNPVREEIVRIARDRAERDLVAKEAYAEFELDESRTTVLVFGGSQGALHVNRAAADACRLLRGRSDMQVLLVTGTAHFETTRRAIPPTFGGDELVVRTAAFLDRMELAYAVADVVVSRAGASTVAELTACGLPSILIPYPYATGRHQEANARAVQRAGGATLLLDDHLTADVLASRIEALVGHAERLRVMSERSRALGHPDAAAHLANVVERVARSTKATQ